MYVLSICSSNLPEGQRGWTCTPPVFWALSLSYTELDRTPELTKPQRMNYRGCSPLMMMEGVSLLARDHGS